MLQVWLVIKSLRCPGSAALIQYCLKLLVPTGKSSGLKSINAKHNKPKIKLAVSRQTTALFYR